MAFKVIWSDAAIADLHNLCTYIARHDPHPAPKKLVESLDFSDGGDIQTLWAAEAIQRRDEVRSDRVQPIPGEQVLAEVRRIVGR